MEFGSCVVGHAHAECGTWYILAISLRLAQATHVTPMKELAIPFKGSTCQCCKSGQVDGLGPPTLAHLHFGGASIQNCLP